jgi:hypothetical protein
MTEPLDLDRFRSLAEAYGGDIGRWPASLQNQSRLTAHAPEAEKILREAGKLDAILSSLRVEASPAPGLAEKIIAAAPRMHGLARRRLRLWWTCIGLAAALSGAAAGSVAAATLVPSDHGYATTLFGDFGDEED